MRGKDIVYKIMARGRFQPKLHIRQKCAAVANWETYVSNKKKKSKSEELVSTLDKERKEYNGMTNFVHQECTILDSDTDSDSESIEVLDSNSDNLDDIDSGSESV